MSFKYNPLTNQLDYTGSSGTGSGSWNSIVTQTISSPTSSVNFNSLSASYQEFHLAFNNVITSSSDILLVRFSTDNGSTFLNCSYQLNANSSSMFNYNSYILYTSNSSANSKTGNVTLNNSSGSSSKSVCVIGSDTNLGSNGGVATGTLFSSSLINFMSLKTAGGSNLTGGSVTLYGR